MKKFLISLIILSSTVLVGCGNKAVVDAKPMIEQEILLQPCTTDTPLPVKKSVDSTGQVGYDGKEILSVLIAWQNTYNDCATKMDSLIVTIRKLQNKNVTIKIKE